jgi:hypothetical protein
VISGIGPVAATVISRSATVESTGNAICQSSGLIST